MSDGPYKSRRVVFANKLQGRREGELGLRRNLGCIGNRGVSISSVTYIHLSPANMAGRASLYPTSAAAASGPAGANSSAASIKQRQISILADRLAELSNRTAALDIQIRAASEHADIMRQYAAQQAAMCVV